MEERILAQTYVNSEVYDTTTEVISMEEQIQRSLREQYGIPPEGFKWDYQGNLVAIPDIESMNAEDIVYTYLQSLHMLDFATAQRVAAASSIIETFEDYYSDITAALADSEDEYDRSLMKLCLENMEIEGISNTVVQANGTYVFTVDITCLDLTNKEFWRDDEYALYQTMYAYDNTETDSTKKEQYLYSYILDAYKKKICGEHTISVDLVVVKANNGGWLIKDDNSLRKNLLNVDGLSLSAYINAQYNEWVLELQSKRAGSSYDEDIGFGRNEETYEGIDTATDTTQKQSDINQKLQEELEYYKQNGTLDRTAETTTDNASSDTSEVTQPTEEGITQSGGTTESEQNSTTEQQHQQQEKLQQTDPNEDIGYGKGD